MNTIICTGVAVMVFMFYFVIRCWPDDSVKASDVVYAMISAYVAGLVMAGLLKLWGV